MEMRCVLLFCILLREQGRAVGTCISTYVVTAKVYSSHLFLSLDLLMHGVRRSFLSLVY